jgi:hypothetical protein
MATKKAIRNSISPHVTLTNKFSFIGSFKNATDITYIADIDISNFLVKMPDFSRFVKMINNLPHWLTFVNIQFKTDRKEKKTQEEILKYRSRRRDIVTKEDIDGGWNLKQNSKKWKTMYPVAKFIFKHYNRYIMIDVAYIDEQKVLAKKAFGYRPKYHVYEKYIMREYYSILKDMLKFVSDEKMLKRIRRQLKWCEFEHFMEKQVKILPFLNHDQLLQQLKYIDKVNTINKRPDVKYLACEAVHYITNEDQRDKIIKLLGL